MVCVFILSADQSHVLCGRVLRYNASPWALSRSVIWCSDRRHIQTARPNAQCSIDKREKLSFGIIMARTICSPNPLPRWAAMISNRSSYVCVTGPGRYKHLCLRKLGPGAPSRYRSTSAALGQRRTDCIDWEVSLYGKPPITNIPGKPYPGI
jgi:hypothetical protein